MSELLTKYEKSLKEQLEKAEEELLRIQSKVARIRSKLSNPERALSKEQKRKSVRVLELSGQKVAKERKTAFKPKSASPVAVPKTEKVPAAAPAPGPEKEESKSTLFG